MTKQLKNSFYVDDLVAGAADEGSAIEFFQAAREIMLAAGMNLQKWKSNSHLVMDKIDASMAMTEGKSKAGSVMSIEEEDRTYVRSIIGQSIVAENQASKILGVMWGHVSDTFWFDLTHIESYVNSMKVCKRSVLGLTAKIFNPLGFLSPFVIQIKILFQSLYKEKTEWDTELCGGLLEKWKTIMCELNLLDKV